MSVPPGYKFPSPYDSQVPYVCERCGASIVGSAIGAHDSWHDEQDKLRGFSVGIERALRKFLPDIKDGPLL